MGVVMMKPYVGAYFTDGTYTFGSGVTNTHRILQSIESFASGMNYNTSDVGTTFPQGSEGLMKNVLYVCPVPPSEKLTFDGTVCGNVTVRMKSPSEYSIYLTKVYVDIVTIDSLGAELSLIGGETNILDSTIQKYQTDQTVAIPFWLTIEKKTVTSSDRIGLRVKLYGYITGTWAGPENYFSMDLKVDSSADQLKFEMPVVVPEA